MKRLESLARLIAVFALTILSACTDDEKKCGDSHQERYIALYSFSATSFAQYLGHVDAGNVVYSTEYLITSDGQASFIYRINAVNVCAYHDPMIFSTLVLNFADPQLRDSLLIASNDGISLLVGLTPSNDVLYDTDQIYTFNGTTNPTNLDIVSRISFPTLGSWANDSTYFFNLVDSYNMGGSYKTTD